MKNKKIILFLLLIWPFLYLFPLSTGLIAMGNDFDLVYYSYKKYMIPVLRIQIRKNTICYNMRYRPR